MPVRRLEVRDLGRLGWAQAYELQRELVERRKRGEIPDQLLFVEHPHVVTLGRNAQMGNVLASPEMMARSGIEVHSTDRGGDVTYHGPGQLVGYLIFDLRDWKRDVGLFLRGIEEAVIQTLAGFGLTGERDAEATGVWVASQGSLKKICAIGVHLSRWVTSHGFALNVTTDLSYFRHIVPCGLTRPVTSLEDLGVAAGRGQVMNALAIQLARQFDMVPGEVLEPQLITETQ